MNFQLGIGTVNKVLTQFTTGGKSDAEIATPIIGPAAPSSSASATPVPDVNAQAIPIHSERAFPLRGDVNMPKSNNNKHILEIVRQRHGWITFLAFHPLANRWVPMAVPLCQRSDRKWNQTPNSPTFPRRMQWIRISGRRRGEGGDAVKDEKLKWKLYFHLVPYNQLTIGNHRSECDSHHGSH